MGRYLHGITYRSEEGNLELCCKTFYLKVEMKITNEEYLWVENTQIQNKMLGPLPILLQSNGRPIIHNHDINYHSVSNDYFFRDLIEENSGRSYEILTKLDAIIDFLLFRQKKVFDQFTKNTYWRTFSPIGYLFNLHQKKNAVARKLDHAGLFNTQNVIIMLSTLLDPLLGELKDIDDLSVENRWAMALFSAASVLFSLPLPVSSKIRRYIVEKYYPIKNWCEKMNQKCDLWENEKTFLMLFNDDRLYEFHQKNNIDIANEEEETEEEAEDEESDIFDESIKIKKTKKQEKKKLSPKLFFISGGILIGLYIALGYSPLDFSE